MLVTLYISIHYSLVYNNGMGRREELMMTLLILIFYYIFIVENNESLKNRLIILILISVFTLTHPTAGIFTYLTFLFFFFISKLKILKFNVINNIQMLLISLSLLSSLLFWLIFCFFKFGDPLYTFTMQNQYFKLNPDLFVLIISEGLNKGIAWEIQIMFNLIGIVFTLLCFITIFKYYKKKEVLFLYGLLIINFLYISCFVAASGLERLIYYFFPFIFFLGFIFIINIWYEKKDMEVISINLLKYKFKIIYNHVFILFLLVFIIKQGLCYFYYFVIPFWPIFNKNFEEYVFYISLIGEILLLFIIIFPTHYIKNER